MGSWSRQLSVSADSAGRRTSGRKKTSNPRAFKVPLKLGVGRGDAVMIDSRSYVVKGIAGSGVCLKAKLERGLLPF